MSRLTAERLRDFKAMSIILGAEADEMIAEIEALWEEARRFYAADGSYTEHDPDEVVRLRKKAAAEVERLRAERKSVLIDYDPELQEEVHELEGQLGDAERANAALRAWIEKWRTNCDGTHAQVWPKQMDDEAKALLAEHAPAEGGGPTEDFSELDGPGEVISRHTCEIKRVVDLPSDINDEFEAPAEGVCSLCGNTGQVDPGGTVHDQPAPLLPCPYCDPAPCPECHDTGVVSVGAPGSVDVCDECKHAEGWACECGHAQNATDHCDGCGKPMPAEGEPCFGCKGTGVLTSGSPGSVEACPYCKPAEGEGGGGE